MAAVIRVKRRVDEDPLEAFVLNSKRRKEEVDTGKDEVSTILKFAGTVQNQTDSLSQATKLTKDEARSIVNRVRKEPLDQMRQKNRDEQRQNAQNERFRIVNCSRTTNDGPESSADAAEITILDIEKQSEPAEGRLRAAADSSQSSSSKEPPPPTAMMSDQQQVTQLPSTSGRHTASGDGRHDYVYDLYVPDVGQPELEWSEQFLENMLRVEPYDQLLFNCYRDPDKADYSDGDSDDSNQENYYQNDYPDSDESTGERAIRRAVESMQLAEDGGDESSDDEDLYEQPASKPDEYVHTLEVDEPGFVGDVDFQDTANRYGIAYAKYKKKILKAFENAQEVPTDDDDEDKSFEDSDYFEAHGSDRDEDCYSENELDKFA